MIRFAAIVSVVAVAIGLLIAGAVSGDLSLVYVSIGLAALALLMLVVGVAIWRDQVFGGKAAPAGAARLDADAADVALPGAWLPDAAQQADAARRAHPGRKADPAARAEAAVAELGGLTERKPEHRPAARQMADASAGRDGTLSAGRPDDWAGDPGHSKRDPRAEPAWERPARSGSPQDRPDRKRVPDEQSAQEPPPQDPPPRRPAQDDRPDRKPAPQEQSARKPPPQDPPPPAVAADIGPGDDPTRLARRLGSAAELSRQPSPPARRTPGAPPSADPLTGPPPAASITSGRTRLQKEAAAAAAAADAGAAGAAVADAEVADAGAPSAEVASAEAAVADVAVSDEAPASDTATDDTAGGDTANGDTANGDTANGDTANGDTGAEADSTVSVVPGIARYHMADCILIRFLSAEDLETMTRQAAEASGCVPCRACRPEKAAEAETA